VEGKGIRSIAVWNVVGQVVSEQEYKKTDKVTVDVSNLPSGVYMVRVNDVWVGKVVKE
jgi:ABC-type transporter Mla subunit MlaD